MTDRNYDEIFLWACLALLQNTHLMQLSWNAPEEEIQEMAAKRSAWIFFQARTFVDELKRRGETATGEPCDE